MVFPSGCDIEFTTEEDPKVRFPDDGPGEYPAQLVAISNLGCRDSISQIVEIQGELVVYVPNAFTPDFDGVNDVFYPVILLPEEIKYFDLRIVNRWGNEVFATQSLDDYWTGESIGETHFVEDETFMWKIQLQLKDQAEIKELTGFVTVIR